MSVWPQKVHQEFEDHWRMERSWKSLLSHLFPMDRFIISDEHYYVPTTLQSAGSWFRLKIERYDRFDDATNLKTVLLIQFEPESRVTSAYWRAQVDHETRTGMDKMRETCSHPTIHGLAVFGRRVAFYTKTDDEVFPPRPPFHVAADLAPETMWELEVTSGEGAERLKKMVEYIIAACDGEVP
ncbi:hypothetical protein MVEN_00617000 [Mycena venus]|uniref:Uncharacterized protein n=1 Tax=Mycena venus TaxID=2733690 RepID=A0A8H6YPW7_9AGAR|nr:hypothetical protein MVEN_00617000 [Mycena venus]